MKKALSVVLVLGTVLTAMMVAGVGQADPAGYAAATLKCAATSVHPWAEGDPISWITSDGVAQRALTEKHWMEPDCKAQTAPVWNGTSYDPPTMLTQSFAGDVDIHVDDLGYLDPLPTLFGSVKVTLWLIPDATCPAGSTDGQVSGTVNLGLPAPADTATISPTPGCTYKMTAHGSNFIGGGSYAAYVTDAA